MFEIAYRAEDGTIVRGGIKVTKRTAQKWAKCNTELDGETEFFVVEADENAITYAEWLKNPS